MNVEHKIEGSKLIITVDLTKDYGPSKSGKSHIVASTEYFANVGDSHPGHSFNLTVIRKK